MPLTPVSITLPAPGDDIAEGAAKVNAAVLALQTAVNNLIAVAGGKTIPPTAAFTVTSAGRTITADASTSVAPNGSITGWDWNWGDGTTHSMGPTATHTYTAPGTYTVTLSITDNLGRGNTTSRQVTVNSAPVASFTATPSGLTVGVDASGSVDDGSIVQYGWIFGDGGTAAGVTTAHTYTASGTFTITLTVTDNSGLTNTTTRSVTVASAPTATTGGDAGGTGIEPSGSGITSWSKLSGSEFSARVNAAGSGLCSLPTGTYSFSDFTFNGGGTPPTQFWFGAKITTAGILGAGSKYTTIQMTPNTSTKASDVPSQGTGSSNQLQYVYITTANAKIDGVKILGTTQGHLYNGLRIQAVSNPTVSNMTIANIPGNAGSPPGETFGINFQGCTGTVTVTNVTADGGGVSAAVLGSNNSAATYNITNLYTFNHPYSAGWASWEHQGTMNFYNFKCLGARAFNAERLVGTVNFYDPIWSDPKSQDLNPTYESGWTGGKVNFYFSSAAAWQRFLAARTSRKYIYALTNSSSVSLGVSKSIIKVYLGNGGTTSPVDAAGFHALTYTQQTTANYVQWGGALTGG